MAMPGVIDLSAGARGSGMRFSMDASGPRRSGSSPTDTSPSETPVDYAPRYSLSLLNTIQEEPSMPVDELVRIVSQASQQAQARV